MSELADVYNTAAGVEPAVAGDDGKQTTTSTEVQQPGKGGAPKGTPPAGESKREEADSFKPWMEQLPKDLRDEATVKKLAKFEKMDGVVKEYLELAANSEKSLKLPEKDEEWPDFYGKIGKPKTKDDYSFAKEEGAAEVLDKFHGAHLTDAQAKALFISLRSDGLQKIAAMREAQQKEIEKTESDLRLEYGEKWSEKKDYMTRGLKAVGKDVVSAIANAGLIGNAGINKLFIMLGETTSEKLVGKGTSVGGGEYRSLSDGGILPRGD